MKMIFALLSLFGTSAFAAVTTVQQNLMPAAQQNEINGTLMYTGGTIKQNDTTKTNASLVALNGTYYFGLTDTQAIGVGTGYTVGHTETKFGTTTVNGDTKGVNDLAVLYKGNFDLGFPTLFVQGGFHLSPEDDKSTQTSTNNYEYTASNGRNYLQATVGMVFPYEIMNWGFSGTYTKRFEGTYNSVDNTDHSNDYSAKMKEGDGYLLSAFAELNNVVHPNLSLIYRRTYSTEYNYSYGSTSRMGGSGSDVITIQGSVRFILNPNIELLPFLGLAFLTDKSKSDVDEYTVAQTGVTGRFLF